MKRFAIILLLVAGLSPWGRVTAQVETANGIAVIVNQAVITYKDVDDLIMPVVDQLSRLYGRDPQVFQQKLMEARREGVEQLVERQLILHDFVVSGYTIPETIIEDEIQRRILSRFGNNLTLTKTLQAEGLTRERYRQQIREQIIVEVLRAKNISSALLISPHKIETYYESHKSEFKSEEQVKLRMIVVNQAAGAAPGTARKLASEILLKLKEGAPFADLAGIYSDGVQRSDGGSWGWVERRVLKEELSNVAFSLKAGDLSGVIETPEACYLMLVEDKRAAGPKPLSEVREDIDRTLLQQEQNRLQKKYVDRLKTKSFIRYFTVVPG